MAGAFVPLIEPLHRTTDAFREAVFLSPLQYDVIYLLTSYFLDVWITIELPVKNQLILFCVLTICTGTIDISTVAGDQPIPSIE